MQKLIFFLGCSLLYLYAQAADLNLPKEFAGESLISEKKISVALTDEGRKGLVVVFMSTKCPCSNSHVELLKNLSAAHPDFKFLILHSNLEEPKPEARKYFRGLNLGFEVLQDDNTKYADLLKAYKTPHAFLFSPAGEILYRGGVTDSTNAQSSDRQYLADALNDVAKGEKVKRPEGRTLGCVIARAGEKNVF